MALTNTLLITGLPRAGTTLSCNILNSHANVLALHEPLTPTDFNPAAGRTAAVGQIERFALTTRAQALSQGVARSRHRDGVVPDNPVVAEVSDSGLRKSEVSLGLIDVNDRIQDEQFTLVIKHNALFTALLPDLQAAFPVFGIVRNPLAVLASWNSVDLPVNTGHVPAGEMFSPGLQQQLGQTPDAITRQLHILEWFCRSFVEYLPGRVMRYEDFVVNPAHIGEFLSLPTPYASAIQSRKNRNDGYDLALMEGLYGRLKAYGDAIWQFYSRDQVDALMESIRATA